ncbi:juvenile hormone esterase-like [Planococcus citri]|uniref:juvenile hormone esterase-like n=1 Tax=Planococcus citri TaxID=170843 RepID=UPI0031F95203
MNSVSFVIFFVLLSYANCYPKREKVYNTRIPRQYLGELHLKDGIINGTIGRTLSGREYMQFYSIPYAEPPVGELRFKDPLPVKPWNGTIDASKPPPECMQKAETSNDVTGKEDCLYLNVFVPKEVFSPCSRKLPVLVGIYGGSFTSGGSTDYAPDYIMERDIIFVMMNYRVGVLGFFGLNNDELSGNFGLKDQSLAIKWVTKNIDSFCGNPANITLIGESAGSASTHLQMFSPLSKGLFQRAIMQSGSAFSQWAVVHENSAKERNEQLLNVTGCSSKDTLAVLKCLQSIPEQDIQAIVIKENIAFRPIVESNVTNGPFLPLKPSPDTYQTRVPWLTGITSGEGAWFVQGSFMSTGGLLDVRRINQNKLLYMPEINFYRHTAKPEDLSTISQKIIDYYFGTEDIGLDTAAEVVDMLTDSAIFYPFMKTVQSSNETQYLYLYDHEGIPTLDTFKNLTVYLGIAHGDDLPLLFRNASYESQFTPKDKKVSNNLLKFWINYAISGDPNANSVKKIWKPVQTENAEYLHIKADSLTMEKNLYQDRFNFWESLPLGWY